MRWHIVRARWSWAILGAIFGLVGPAAGIAKAKMDGNDVPLSYVLADYDTTIILARSVALSVVLFVLFGLILTRVSPGLRRFGLSFRS